MSHDLTFKDADKWVGIIQETSSDAPGEAITLRFRDGTEMAVWSDGSVRVMTRMGDIYYGHVLDAARTVVPVC